MKQGLVFGLAMVMGTAALMVGQAKAAQTKTSLSAPAAQTDAAHAPSATTPVAQAPTPAVKFPPVNLKNFTADSPTSDQVNAFLKASWGYDSNRVWEVEGIVKTKAPGVAKVVVLVADDRQPGKFQRTVFFTTPDGQHAISGDVIDFGPKPYEETRKTLQERAVGPARGAKSNALMLVEFSDLQCEQCKDAQDKMDNLAEDFPQAKIVFENYPLVKSHPYSLRAAEHGICVRKTKGDEAFFTYVRAIYAKQAGLTPTSVDATLQAAEKEAGADPSAVAECVARPLTKQALEASLKLGVDVGVNQTPAIAVNGRLLPLASVPYEMLKQIVAFQAQQDGITVHLQPTLSTLK